MTIDKICRFALACTAAAITFLGVSPSHASLIGSTVSCTIQPTPLWTCDNASAAVVDPGSEFQLLLVGNSFFAVDFSDDALTLTLVSGGALAMGAGEVATFGGLSPFPLIAGFSSSGSATGFDLADIAFSNSTLTLGLAGSLWSPGDSATIQFGLANRVAEPGSLALLGLGLTGLALVRRRRASA